MKLLAKYQTPGRQHATLFLFLLLCLQPLPANGRQQGAAGGAAGNQQQGQAAAPPQNSHVGAPLKVPAFAKEKGYSATQNSDGSLTVTTPSGKTLRLYRDVSGTLQTESATGAIPNQQVGPNFTPPKTGPQEQGFSQSDIQSAAAANGMGTNTTPLRGTISTSFDGRNSIKIIEYENQDGSSTTVLLYTPVGSYGGQPNYIVTRHLANSSKYIVDRSGVLPTKDPSFSVASFADNLAQQAANAGPQTSLVGAPGTNVAPGNPSASKSPSSNQPLPNSAPDNPSNRSLDTSAFNDDKALEEHLKEIGNTPDDAALMQDIIDQVEKSLGVPDTGAAPGEKSAAPVPNIHSSNPTSPNTNSAPGFPVPAGNVVQVDQPAPGLVPANGAGQQGPTGGNAINQQGSTQPTPPTSTTGSGNTTQGAAANTTTTAGENFGPRVQGGPYNVPIYVYNNGKSAQTVQVSVQNAPWLTLTGPTTVQVVPGGQPEAVNAQINTTNLPPGVYTGTIIYTCTTCSDPNSPPTTYTGQVTVQVVPSATSFGGPANPNDSQFRGLVNGQPADLCTVLQGAISEVANSSFGATAAGQAIVSKLRKDYLSNNCEHLKPTATVSIPDKSGKPNEQTQAVDGESEKPGNAVYVLNIGPGPYFYAHLFADEDIYVGIDLTPTGVARARQNPGDYYIFTYQGKIGVVPRSELISTLIHEGLHAVQSGKYNVPRPNGTGNASSTEEEQDGFNAGDQAIQALGYPPEGVTVGKGYGRGSNPNYKPLITTGATQQAGTTAPAPKTAPSTGGVTAQPGMNPSSNQPANPSNPSGPVKPAGTNNAGTGNAASNSATNNAGTNNAPAAAGGTTVSATNVPGNSSATTAADCNCNLNALLQAFHDAQDAENAAETALQNAQTRANADQAALDAATQALQNPPPGSNPAALQASYNIAQANDAASQAALRTAMTNYAKAQEATKAAELAYDNCVAAKKNCPPPTNAATGPPNGNTGNNSGTNGNSSANNTSASNAANAAAAAAENAANKANETKVSTPPMESGAAARNPKPAPKGALPSGEPGNSNNGGDNNGADNGANNGNAGDNPPPPNPTPAAEKRPKNFRHAQPATDPTGITEPNQYTVTVCEGTNDYVFRAGGEEVDARNVNSTSHDATGVGFGNGVRISGNHVGSSTIDADFFSFDGTLAAHVKIHVTVIDCGHHATVVGDNNNGLAPNPNPPVVTGVGGNANANPPGGDDNPKPAAGEGNNENPPPGGDTGESSYFDPSDGFDELNNSLFGNAAGAPTVQYIVLTINVNFAGTAPQASLGQGMWQGRSRPLTAMNRLRASRTHARFQLAAYRLGSPARAPSGELHSSDRDAFSLLASLPSTKGLTFSIASNGNLGSNALVFRVHDPSGRLKGNVRLPEGMVLEPLKMGTRNPVSPAGGGSSVAQPLTAYCLEMAKLPPEAGQLYRLAPQAVQQKYKPIRGVLRAGSKLAAVGKFHPDSDPSAYADFIRQHALWAQLENWTEQKFTEVFLERTRKNAEHLNVKWTNEMTDALRAAAPGRWRDIAMVLDEAHKLSGAAEAP